MTRTRRGLMPGAIAEPAAYAQGATAIETIGAAGLTAETRTEVRARVIKGNTIPDVLTTMQPDNITATHVASRIVTMGFDRGIAAVKVTDGRTAFVNSDTTILAVRS
ncbi:MAG: hypothetical protein AB7O80_17620 [Acetobacteraceae bacterium]